MEERLQKYFGDSWIQFSKRLDELFYSNNRAWKQRKGTYIYNDDMCDELKRKMIKHYRCGYLGKNSSKK